MVYIHIYLLCEFCLMLLNDLDGDYLINVTVQYFIQFPQSLKCKTLVGWLDVQSLKKILTLPVILRIVKTVRNIGWSLMQILRSIFSQPRSQFVTLTCATIIFISTKPGALITNSLAMTPGKSVWILLYLLQWQANMCYFKVGEKAKWTLQLLL